MTAAQERNATLILAATEERDCDDDRLRVGNTEGVNEEKEDADRCRSIGGEL